MIYIDFSRGENGNLKKNSSSIYTEKKILFIKHIDITIINILIKFLAGLMCIDWIIL